MVVWRMVVWVMCWREDTHPQPCVPSLCFILPSWNKHIIHATIQKQKVGWIMTFFRFCLQGKAHTRNHLWIPSLSYYRVAKTHRMSHLDRSFSAKEPYIISGSCAKHDLQLKTSYASSPPCTIPTPVCKRLHAQTHSIMCACVVAGETHSLGVRVW